MSGRLMKASRTDQMRDRGVPQGSSGFRAVPQGSVLPGSTGFFKVLWFITAQDMDSDTLRNLAPGGTWNPANLAEPCELNPAEPRGTLWNPVEPNPSVHKYNRCECPRRSGFRPPIASHGRA